MHILDHYKIQALHPVSSYKHSPDCKNDIRSPYTHTDHENGQNWSMNTPGV